MGETSHAEHIQEGHVVYGSMFAKYIHKTSLPGARKRRPFEIQTSKTSALVGPDVEASGGVRTVHGGRRTSILWPCHFLIRRPWNLFICGNLKTN